MIPRSIFFGLLLSFQAVAAPERAWIAELDEQKLIETTQFLLTSSVTQKRIYHPETMDITLEDAFDFLRESSSVNQYARSFITRSALNHLPTIERVKSPQDFSLILHFISFGIIWSSDTVMDAFAQFLERPNTPLLLRLKTLAAVMKVAESELHFMPIPRRKSRVFQFDKMQVNLLQQKDPPMIPPELPLLKEQILHSNMALLREFCEDTLKGGP